MEYLTLYKATNNATSRRLMVRWIHGFVRLAERMRRSVWTAIKEENNRAYAESRAPTRDLFDELPDPPHLEYGETRYRNGRFKQLDG